MPLVNTTLSLVVTAIAWHEGGKTELGVSALSGGYDGEPCR